MVTYREKGRCNCLSVYHYNLLLRLFLIKMEQQMYTLIPISNLIWCDCCYISELNPLDYIGCDLMKYDSFTY